MKSKILICNRLGFENKKDLNFKSLSGATIVPLF